MSWKASLPYVVLALVAGAAWLGYAHGSEIMRRIRFGTDFTPEVRAALAKADEAAKEAQVHAASALRNQALAREAAQGARAAAEKARNHVAGYASQSPIQLRGATVYTYEGQIDRANSPDGLQIVRFADGSVYEGAWKQGLPEGYGIMTYSGQRVHAGQWKAGVNLGDGITLSNGLSWEGQLMEGDDLASVYWGVLTCDASETCHTRAGAFKLAAGAAFGLDGPGVVVMKDGRQLKGIWKNGVQEGYGAVLDAKGGMLEQGNFHNGQL
jgi:hypothetical protein